MFDLFYKIKTLHHLGVKIHLHCFEYGRGVQPELDKYCEEVIYYPRKRLVEGISLRLPYIVSSRKNPGLIKNISKDSYPVLLEGIHCTYYLYHGELSNRKVWVRLHNVEYEYYRQLAKSTGNYFKKLYFLLESRLLKRYEKVIAQNGNLIAVNKKDQLTYQRTFSAKNIQFLPVFLPFDEVKSKTGKGNFCLYHGNLSVSENEKAVWWLIENVFNFTEFPFVIAGKNPSPKLKLYSLKNKNIQLIANPSQHEMDELIQNAHIHIIPSFNTTGIKIKLLNALFNGRFVVTNNTGVAGTDLEMLCSIAGTPSDYIKTITELWQLPFSQNNINMRDEVLKNQFNNEKNGQQLIEWL